MSDVWPADVPLSSAQLSARWAAEIALSGVLARHQPAPAPAPPPRQPGTLLERISQACRDARGDRPRHDLTRGVG